MSNAIFILGGPRSGAGLVAGILEMLGVDIGDHLHLAPADVLNPTGYFEDLAWRTVNRKASGHKLALSNRVVLEFVTKPAVSDYVKSRYGRLILAASQRSETWAVKGRRLAFSLQHVWPLLKAEQRVASVKIIEVSRPAADMVREWLYYLSLANGGQFAANRKEAEWLVEDFSDQIERRLAEFAGHYPGGQVLTVCYDQLIKDPAGVVDGIGDFLHLQNGLDHAAAVGLIDPKLANLGGTKTPRPNKARQKTGKAASSDPKPAAVESATVGPKPPEAQEEAADCGC